jgi:hypothetical protein
MLDAAFAAAEVEGHGWAYGGPAQTGTGADEVLEARTASGRKAVSMRVNRSRLIGRRSEAFSCTKSAFCTASSGAAQKRQASGEAMVKMPRRDIAGQASAM